MGRIYSGSGTGSEGRTLSDSTVTSGGGGWTSTPIPGATGAGGVAVPPINCTALIRGLTRQLSRAGSSSTDKLHSSDLGCFAKCSGNFTATLSWVASDGISPPKTAPPKTLYLREAVAAVWDLSGCTNTSILSAQVDDGKNDPPVMGQGATISSSGVHLVQVDSSSGIIVRNVNMSSSGTISNNPNLSGEFESFCNYNVSIDTRALTVTRDGAHNETVDADGTIHGDTVFSISADGYLNSYTERFYANLAGQWSRTGWWPFTSPNVSSNWNFSPSMQVPTSWVDKLTAMRYTPVGTKLEQSAVYPTIYTGPDDSPKVITVTANVTDKQDGAQATANYILTIHDPVETLTHTTAKTAVNLRPAPNGYWITNANNIPEQATGSLTHYTEWAVGVSIGNVAAVAEWVLSDIGIGLNFTVNVGFQTGFSISVTLPPHYRSQFMMEDLVVRHVGTSNTYDSGGFLGVQPFTFDVPDSPAGAILMAPPTPDPTDPANSGSGK